ncbi:MAG TPA: TraB/GumN family protein [Candidatus Thermoplasmatota archaeon]|nr:TraB/GumN family protein [Candidatus Thermoplasmatota archaeon]
MIVGTAHVSQASVNEVRETIARVNPDVVAVELDEPRHQALTDKRRFEETPITELIKGGKSFLVIAQALLGNWQRRIGEKQGVEPGAEMKAALEEAKARNKKVVLADRDIGVTLRRAWGHMGLGEKWRLMKDFMKALVGAPASEEEDEVDVDKMLEEDTLTLMMSELKATAPSISQVLIHERDQYLAHNIREAAKSGTVVAVVGAGHVKGILHHLDNPDEIPPLEDLEVIPKKRFSWLKLLGWIFWAALGAALLFGVLCGIQTGDWMPLGEFVFYSVLAGGLACALGALLAGGHPLTVLAGIPAAPLGTLSPTIAAGWITGYVEAKMRPPTMKDFQTIGKMETFGDMWRNRVMRVLMVASLSNIGNMIANFFVVIPLAGAVIAMCSDAVWALLTGLFA